MRSIGTFFPIDFKIKILDCVGASSMYVPHLLMCQPDVGANLVFALELITLSFLCKMGEHKVRPYTLLAHK